MTFLQELQARRLPPVVPEGMTEEQWPAYREQLIELFSREEYGFSPPPPTGMRSEILPFDGEDWAGKARERLVKLSFDTPGGEFSFPVHFVLPHEGNPRPLIIYLSFEPYIHAYYMPVEEIIDSGFALATFDYQDVTSDDANMADGLAGMYGRSNDDGSMWGKIGMWAYAASRVLDYARTLDGVGIDNARVFVVGHSRLGKTALWCAAQDERFAGVGVNDSGCSGMAVNRGKRGEDVAKLTAARPHWFCGNYRGYARREYEMPFDQHMLAALIAPRPLAVCNAELDFGADPRSEFISVYEAGKAYELLGVPGLAAPAAYPEAPARFPGGRIGYSLRRGTHYMSRDDWGFYLKFFCATK